MKMRACIRREVVEKLKKKMGVHYATEALSRTVEKWSGWLLSADCGELWRILTESYREIADIPCHRYYEVIVMLDNELYERLREKRYECKMFMNDIIIVMVAKELSAS